MVMSSIVSAKDLPKCYKPEEIKKMADYTKACDKCQLDLSDTKLALDVIKNRESEYMPTTYFAGGAIGGAVVVFLICSIGKCGR